MRYFLCSIFLINIFTQTFAQSITPLRTLLLPDSLSETSGLIFFNNQLWTHNDDTDRHLYTLDTATVAVNSLALDALVNKEWEDIAQNSQYVFLGDFGNNANGNRTDLHILRIEKSSLLAGLPVADTIYFTYNDQTDFSGSGNNNTDFDCEAMIAYGDSLYLFTKQWVSHKTAVYVLLSEPGNKIAQKRDEFDCQGLITGADISPSGQRLALCGYSENLQPFLVLSSGFGNNHFFSGEVQQVNVLLAMHQVEGIAATNENIWYLSNEKFTVSTIVNIPAAIHRFDLTTAWATIGVEETKVDEGFHVYPNPTVDGYFVVQVNENTQLEVFDQEGRLCINQVIAPGETRLALQETGLYLLRVYTSGVYHFCRLVAGESVFSRE